MMELFIKRRAVRKYSSKPVTEKQLRQIIKAAMYAPSGHNKHPLHFIVIRDEEMKQKLSRVNQWSACAGQAATVIVVCADERQSLVWLEDASVATGYMWLECAELDLGGCWIHVHGSKRPDGSDGENYVKKLLKIPSDWRVVCFLAVGYPLKKPMPHSASEYSICKVSYGKWGKRSF